MTNSEDWVKPPSLPLSSSELERALRLGRGRAIQHLRQYGSSGAESAILSACLSEPLIEYYDPDSFAPWLAAIVINARLADRVIDAIAAEEAETTTAAKYEDLDHRRDMLLALARRSIPRARETLYSALKVHEDPRDFVADEVLGASQIVELDGIQGLLTVAGRIGQWLALHASFDPEEVDVGLWALDESIDRDEGRRALKAAADHDLNIARLVRYLEQANEQVEATPDSGAWRPTRALEFRLAGSDEVISRVQHPKGVSIGWLRGWGRYASEEQLDSVLAEMLLEADRERIRQYLRVFAHKGVPRIEDHILSWLDPDGDLVQEAVLALEPHSDPRLRELALERLAPPLSDIRYVSLLAQNYEPGDHVLLERLLEVISPDQIHGVAYDMLKVWEENPVLEAACTLCFIFEQALCQNCRTRSLVLLADIDSIPDWVREEAELDYCPEIRRLVNH